MYIFIPPTVNRVPPRRRWRRCRRHWYGWQRRHHESILLLLSKCLLFVCLFVIVFALSSLSHTHTLIHSCTRILPSSLPCTETHTNTKVLSRSLARDVSCPRAMKSMKFQWTMVVWCVCSQNRGGKLQKKKGATVVVAVMCIRTNYKGRKVDNKTNACRSRRGILVVILLGGGFLVLRSRVLDDEIERGLLPLIELRWQCLKPVFIGDAHRRLYSTEHINI